MLHDRFLLAVGFLLASTAPAIAGAQEIRGLVFDQASSAPVPGAEVIVLSGDWKPVARDTADARGRFTLGGIEQGTYTLVARAAGMVASAPTEVVLDSGNARQLMVGLRPLPGFAAVSREGEGDEKGSVVYGTVKTRRGDPVSGAEVVLETLGEKKAVLSGRTGRFLFEKVPAGAARLTVRQLGYEEVSDYVEVRPGTDSEVFVRLVEDPIEIEGIEVVTRSRSSSRRLRAVYERMERGLGGYFFTREDLAQMPSMPIGLAIDRLPRTRVRKGTGPYYHVSIRGCGQPALYVDGVLMYRPGGPPTDLYSLSTSELEAVEVYPGPATTPGEFIRLGVRCAIAVWTKRGG
ncbi:MAG: carboxypeptidase regulatory-like domain-containing protein [Gemmatimonadota bacterium]